MAAARSLSAGVKSLYSAVSHNFSGSIVLRYFYLKRSYVATVPGFGKGGSTRVTVGKLEQRANQEAESAWAPDPVTGYYRPFNRADEIDPAELREMLLKNKAKPL
ncbi:hypothetical protein F2Q68_00030573 [Brassica cretica]|uniref:Uncharacterized protein n=2 Tax=Brassica TaxID=3705 RepID=A0A8S9G8G6_BRACR|nr:hypothetical protein F2Q68_00030573 [Brassica cretica]VDD50257.1 unnamed protein product [Brassica oleracea]